MSIVNQLADALRALRGYVDVSTIRPGKRNAFEWSIRVDRADAALAAYDAQQDQPIDAAAALVHAYAHGKANGDHVDWEYVNEAYNLARAEVGEERCAEIEALYGDTT